ncbi:MAG: 3-hydroxyacyl-CoA dehydrogenase family protein [Promethearchaeota archaeon]
MGGGLMGTGIALVSLLYGYEKVTVIDLKSDILDKTRDQIQTRLEMLKSEKFEEYLLDATNGVELAKTLDFESKKGDSKSVGILANNILLDTIMGRLKTETELSEGVSEADFVIEAVPEILSLKQEIFKKLGQYTPPHAVLASNTSTMSITKIGQFSGREDKVIGMHFHVFGYPLLVMFIEVTPGEKTTTESMDLGVEFAQNLPCLIGERYTMRLEKESPGLILNRMSVVGSLYYNWIVEQALSQGITYEQLDAAGMSFEGLDRIGVDTAYNVNKYFEEYVSQDFTLDPLMTKLVEEGRLGRKVGRGYYDWNEDGPIRNPPPVEPKTMEFLAKNIDPELFIALRLNEACRLLEEGVVKNYEAISKAFMKAEFWEGPFIPGKDKYKEWSEKLYTLAEKTGKSYVKPCKLMESGEFVSYK